MRLVICDDHSLLLEAMSTALAARGFIIEAATTTPADAVRCVALHDPDLLLLDVNFPEGSGLDAARAVMASHPRTKVVLVTASDAPDPLIEALELGVAGYTRKDQRIEGIVDVLHRAVRGEPAVDRGLLRKLTGAARLPQRRTSLAALTARELEVCHLLVKGMSTTEMVKALGIGHSTTRTHVQNILLKLGVHSRLQAVALLAEALQATPAASTDQGVRRTPTEVGVGWSASEQSD